MTTMDDVRHDMTVAKREEEEMFLNELAKNSDEMKALETGTETHGFNGWVELVDGTEIPTAWDVYDIKVRATKDGKEVEFEDEAEITCFVDDYEYDEEWGESYNVEVWFDLDHLERAGYKNIDVLAWKQYGA